MKVGLVDVDSHKFPNICLMKISAWHKAQGDDVEWANSLEYYDKVYMAKVFDDTYTKDDLYAYNCVELIKGGTGYNLTSKLPSEIEHIYPDYSLYGIKDTAYGFLTRGCPRGCKFCIVGKKEGLNSVKVADLKEFWNGQKNIVLCDPNFLACNEWHDLIHQLIDAGKVWVDFNQGLDIRLMTIDKAEHLNRLKIKEMHFAWDNPKDEYVLDKLKEFRPYWKHSNKVLVVYVLVNFHSTFEQDLYRVYSLRDAGYSPYIMIYDKPNCDKKYKHLQRWVNNRFIFWSCESFDKYIKGKK